MTSPTRAEMKATLLAGWKEYWPVFITLLFTYLGWLALCRDDGYFVQAVGAVGVIIFFPLFNLQKNIWFYVAAFFGVERRKYGQKVPSGSLLSWALRSRMLGQPVR